MTSPHPTIPGDAPSMVKHRIREMYYTWMVTGGIVARDFLFWARWRDLKL